MKARDLYTKCLELGIALHADGGQLKVTAAKGLVSPEMLALLKQHKGELLTIVSERADALPRIKPVARDQTHPLSHAQQRLWILSKLEGVTAPYNITLALRLRGHLHPNAMIKALHGMVTRHEVLRTRLVENQGVPSQVVDADSRLQVSVSELPGTAELTAIVREEAQAEFDFGTEHMIRARLLKCADEDWVLLLTLHHIVSDGWSFQIFMHELEVFYNHYSAGNGTAPPLAPLEIQYVDFAHWQKQVLSGREFEEQLHYWTQHLAGLNYQLSLPTDRPRPALRSSVGAQASRLFPIGMLAKLRELSEQHDATLHMSLLTVFAILLHRYTGESDLPIGSPIVNRNRPELEGLIGFLVNTQVMRIEVARDMSFRTLLGRVRELALAAYANQDVPFEAVVESVQGQRNLSFNPLFQVMFAFYEDGLRQPRFNNLSSELHPIDVQFAKFDLAFFAMVTEQQFSGRVEYCSELFDKVTIENFLERFASTLEAVIAAPDVSIEQLKVGGEPERRRTGTSARALLEKLDASKAADGSRAPEAMTAARGIAAAPPAAALQGISRIWQQILNLQDIDVHANFFDVGGNSLRAFRLKSLLESEFRKPIRLVDIFAHTTIFTLAQFLCADAKDVADDAQPAPPPHRSAAGTGDIAVIGMACRFPDAVDTDQYWENLCAGRESLTEFSDEALRAAGIAETLLANPRYVKSGVILEGLDLFDSDFFDETPRGAELMCPQQRLLLECGVEALENGGYFTDTCDGRIGVFQGADPSLYLTRNLKHLGDGNDGDGPDLNMKTSFHALVLSYKLNLTGPSLNISTACSTSLVAIHQACQAVRSGECELALAGGASVFLLQPEGYLPMQGSIQSTDGRCRAFDESSTGARAGSGAAFVLLKSLSRALEDGDTIYGVVKGSAVNNDGNRKVSMNAPSVSGQEEAIRSALRNAGVDAGSVGYIETHGTGTRIGDPIEYKALAKVYAPSRRDMARVRLGAVKQNVGHLSSAAGVAGFIKALQVVRLGAIPGNIHFNKPNPELGFDGERFEINRGAVQWQPGPSPRRAAVSSLGIGGTNAHCILEEPPPPEASASSRPYHLLPISAKTLASLAAASAALRKRLNAAPRLAIWDAAYTLQVGRRAYGRRTLMLCDRQGRELALMSSGGDAAIVVAPPLEFRFHQTEAGLLALCALGGSEPGYMDHIDECLRALPAVFGSELSEKVRAMCKQDAGSGRARLDACTASTKDYCYFIMHYAFARLLMAWGIIPHRLSVTHAGRALAFALAERLAPEDALRAYARRQEYDDVSGYMTTGIEVRIVPAVDSASAADTDGHVVHAVLDIGSERAVEFRRGVAPTGASAGDSAFQLTHALGQLWLHGVSIDWRAYHGHERLRRVALPTYKFDRQRHWIDPPATTGATSLLPQVKQANSDGGGYDRATLEALLSDVWSDLLGRSDIGTRENFFDLGGDSYLLIRLVDSINKKLKVFNLGLKLDDVFDNLTIEETVALIEQQNASAKEKGINRILID